MSNAARPSKNERRDVAREKAREQRVRQQKREKRNRVLLQASIGLVVLAIVAIVAVVIVNSVKPAGPGPRNMANGGLTIAGADLAPVTTAAAAADATPTPETTGSAGKVLIQVYEDFGCPVCQAFEQTNATQLENLVKSGAAEVQYHPVAILDNRFTDGDYSTRAANAAAVVANSAPDAFLKFHSSLYETGVQPEEGGAGLTDDRLVELAKAAGATSAQVEKGIRDQQFAKWIGARTEEFQDDAGSLADVDFPAARTGAGTPTVIVDGQFYEGAPNDADAFGAFVTKVGGAFSASPTPSPSATD